MGETKYWRLPDNRMISIKKEQSGQVTLSMESLFGEIMFTCAGPEMAEQLLHEQVLGSAQKQQPISMGGSGSGENQPISVGSSGCDENQPISREQSVEEQPVIMIEVDSKASKKPPGQAPTKGDIGLGKRQKGNAAKEVIRRLQQGACPMQI